MYSLGETLARKPVLSPQRARARAAARRDSAHTKAYPLEYAVKIP